MPEKQPYSKRKLDKLIERFESTLDQQELLVTRSRKLLETIVNSKHDFEGQPIKDKERYKESEIRVVDIGQALGNYNQLFVGFFDVERDFDNSLTSISVLIREDDEEFLMDRKIVLTLTDKGVTTNIMNFPPDVSKNGRHDNNNVQSLIEEIKDFSDEKKVLLITYLAFHYYKAVKAPTRTQDLPNICDENDDEDYWQ